MSNMSYCQFQNTLHDLIDCEENFDNIESEDEAKSAFRLVQVAKRIADQFEDMTDEEVKEQLNAGIEKDEDEEE